MFLAVRIFSLIDMVFRMNSKVLKDAANVSSIENIMFYTGSLHNFFSTLEGFALAVVILSLRPLKQSLCTRKFVL